MPPAIPRTRGRGDFYFKERDVDGGGQMEDGATRGGMDKADEVAPFIAVLHRRERALPVKTPDLVRDRLEADAMLVHRPQFDPGVRKCRRHLP